MHKINTLVFEGGGIYGLAYIGALKELQKRIDFNNIKYVCGTSVGALIAFAIALGLKPEHMEDVVSKFRIAILLRTPGILLRMPWNAIVNYGLINSDILKDVCLIVLRTMHPDKKDITFKELQKDVIITATNLTDSYFFVASKQTTPEMSVIEAVVHSCCGNIALVPTILKIRKQNKNALVIDGGASILNYPIALFSPHTNPCYISSMLDNDFSRDLYSQYGGKWSDFEKVMRNSHDNKLLGIKFESPNPLHEHTHPQCHITFMELFKYNLPEPPTSDRQGYQIHDQHRHAEDPPVRYILYYDSIQDEAYHRYRA
jgi:predicted acylesterase/phospholipase RssA